MIHRARVLVVDDNPIIRHVLRRDVGRLGFSCATARDGLQCVRMLKEEDFDVVLIDLGMDAMDDLRLLGAIERADVDTVPIVLAARVQMLTAVKALLAGAFDYVSKPPGREALHRAIERAATHHDARRRLREMTGVAEQWDSAFDSWPDVIVMLDREGRILRANRAAADRAGCVRQHLLGMHCHEALCHNDHPLERCPFAASCQDQPVRARDFSQQAWGGCFEIVSVLLGEGRGVPWGSMHVLRNVTEQRMLETQLAQSQKLEGIGQLAAGIAHEINTPMQYLGDNTRFLHESFASLLGLLGKYGSLLEAARAGRVTGDQLADVEAAADGVDLEYLMAEIPHAIRQSLEGVEHVTGIVRAMREFSSGGGDKTAIDLNKAIESTIIVSRNEWKYVAEMRTELDADLPPVMCLPGELNQVVLGLIINAAHAIADVVGDGSAGKGQIALSTRRCDQWVEIRVADTGTGVAEEIRSRIFEPFFTTKEVGRGTGQGLAIARSVVQEKHGGTLSFETEVGKGTTFLIRLPIDPAMEEPDSPVAPEALADVH